jgi:hypothetical protein
MAWALRGIQINILSWGGGDKITNIVIACTSNIHGLYKSYTSLYTTHAPKSLRLSWWNTSILKPIYSNSLRQNQIRTLLNTNHCEYLSQWTNSQFTLDKLKTQVKISFKICITRIKIPLNSHSCKIRQKYNKWWGGNAAAWHQKRLFTICTWIFSDYQSHQPFLINIKTDDAKNVRFLQLTKHGDRHLPDCSHCTMRYHQKI